MFPIDLLKALDDDEMPIKEITFQDSSGRPPKDIFEEGMDEWLEFEQEGNLAGTRLLLCILSIPVLFLLLVLAMVL